MRALLRIATPTGIGLAIAGCSLPVDEFQPPSNTESRVGNTDVGAPDDVSPAETRVDAANDTTEPIVATDSAADACICVKQVGAGKCKEWSPPHCGE